MAGQTVSLLGGALKRDYHGPIMDQLNNLSPTYRLLSKNEEDVSGEDLKAYVPIKTRRNQAIGARAENGPLPTARNVTTIQLAIPLMYNYGAVAFSGQAIKASRKNATAFAKVVDMEIKSMVEGMKIDTNRQLFSPASGFLCMTHGTGGGADATVTVDKPGTQWLEEGMPIESFPDTTTGAAVSDEGISEGLTEATAHQVGGITDSTTFELETYAGSSGSAEKWATDQYVFRYGARGYEMNGLMDIIDNYSIQGTSSWFGLGLGLQTIHGKSRSTYPILEANVLHGSNTNRDLTEQLIQDTLDTVEKASGKNGDNKSMLIVTSYGVRKMYIDLLQADRRYVKPLDLVGGWKAIAYQAGNDYIPLIVDKHCVPNTMFFLDRRFLAIYRASNFDWINDNLSSINTSENGENLFETIPCQLAQAA
ncbi:MAG: phage major capsid protein [Candidatus Omnitrophica bacterium]|nr:phage major capsid protein [Candidatus Omnitrophota bacterium]